MPVGDALPEIVLLLAAVAVLLTASFAPQRRQWLGAPLALAGLAASGYACALQLGEARLTFSGVWAIDGASVWARLMIMGTAAFAVMLTPAWLAEDRRHGEFYAVLLFSTLGAMVLAAAADLLQLVLGVLLSSVTGYTIAAYHRDWPSSVEAGMKYFLIGAFANVLLLIGVTLMFGLLGGSGFAGIAEALAGSVPSSPLLVLGSVLVVVGLAFKLGAVPAHAWMPDVAEGAPAPAAAFLTVAPKIGAAVALARLVDMVPPDGLALRPIVAIVSVATMTLGNLAALWQDDVRRLLGWSSVSQSGYALMAVCVIGLDEAALPALLLFLAGYAAATLTAFAVVTHLRGLTARGTFGGLVWERPWAAGAMILALLSLVGIPPLAGFVGKLGLFMTTIGGGYAWLAVLAVANTVVSLFYYLRVVAPMYFAPPKQERQCLGIAAAVAFLAGAVLVIGIGLAADLALTAFAQAQLLPSPTP